MPGDSYNATLVERINVTPHIAILRVRPDDGVPPFSAGQYTVLGLRQDAPRVPEAAPEEPSDTPPEKLIKRAYSISSGSRMKEYLEFYVSLVGSGALTPRLFALAEGDRLFSGPRPKGLFTLDRVPVEKSILMVATGTGLAPYVSMLRTHALGIPRQPVAVLHGASYSWDLGYRGEMEALNRDCANFAYVPVVSRPAEDPDWQGRTGRLPPWLENPALAESCGFPIGPETAHVFLCGNPAMIEAALESLQANGFTVDTRKDPGTIHVEKYW